MSVDLALIVVLSVVVLLAVALSITLRITAVRSAERDDDLARWTEREVKDLETRIARLEGLSEQSVRPTASNPRDGRPAGIRHPERPSLHVMEAPAAPPPSTREPTLVDIHEDAARALGSANAFNAFAERFQGQGYTLEGGGPTPLPVGGTADKADIYLLPGAGFRLAIPGFNLRRAQGLLTSDAGRAAEARLGWLFDIEPGPELRAVQGATVETEAWTVRHKGRLSIPL